MSELLYASSICFKCIFIFKYYKRNTDFSSYLNEVQHLTEADVDNLYNLDRKSNCTRCQYCIFLAFFNCLWGPVPPTPSPYSSPSTPLRYIKQSLKIPDSLTTSTQRQYHHLYRDFRHASQSELRDQIPSGEGIKNPENHSKLSTSQLDGLVDDGTLEIINSFFNDVYITLVNDYLKLFEEMVKGLILLKETGITFEDILCSSGEESKCYYCQQTKWTMNIDPNLTSCRPYNVAEFEKILQLELKKHFESSLRDISEFSRESAAESGHSELSGKESLSCDCDQPTTNFKNQYLTFLTEEICHSQCSKTTEEFDHVLEKEKIKFLRNILELLREDEYFIFRSESSSGSNNFSANFAECSSPKGNQAQQDINNAQIYNMAERIYNQTICHAQSAILAVLKSMKYGIHERKIFLPHIQRETSNSERGDKISKCKNLIEKSLSRYLMLASSEGEVFIKESFNRDATIQDSGCKQPYNEFQTMLYDDEIKSRTGKCEPRQLENEQTQRRRSQYGPCIEKTFPPLIQDIKQKHPDLEYAEDARRYTHKSLNPFAFCGEKTNISPQNAPKEIAETDFLSQKNAAKAQLPQKSQDSKVSRLNRILFKRKKNAVSVMCVLNYDKPEVTHTEAIAFLKKMETEGGSFHYPHCGENICLKKIEGPPFYLSVSCTDCRKKLAPPQRLEAFKSEDENVHRSKLMEYILRKNRTSFCIPVSCGSCGCLLCDPERAKKRILYVPFHCPVKGYICASLRSHECQGGSSDSELTGCVSDLNNSSACTLGIHMLNKKGLKRGQSYEHLKSPKRMAKSGSLPVFRKNQDSSDSVENVNDTSRHAPARNNKLLEFEDAVTNILNMWTYDMINYEKGANSPQLKSQILNYRKRLSIYIKNDIREKYCYRQRILTVCRCFEEFESPILELKDQIATQTSTLNGKVMRRSRSCHSKPRYQTTSATHRSRSESLVSKDFSPQIDMFIFNHTLSQLEKDSKRAEYFHPEHTCISHYRAGSLEYKNNITSNVRNMCQDKLLNSDKSKGGPYLRTNRKNIVRPVSFHSELKEKTPVTQCRRSCSFKTKGKFSNEINAWNNELLELQKSIENPHLRSEAVNRNNMARPFSVHSEIKQETPTIYCRRSFSLDTESYHKDFSMQINAWKHELLKLQQSVQNPHLGSETMDHNNITKAGFLEPRHESWINEKGFSSQIFTCKNELLQCPKNIETHSTNKQLTQKIYEKSTYFNSDQKYSTNGDINHCQPDYVINKEVSNELNAWQHKLQKLQKGVESPNSRSEIQNRTNKTRALSLGSKPKPKISAFKSDHRPQSELDDSLTELKTWNYRLRELEKDATVPLRSVSRNHKIRTRAISLNSEHKNPTIASSNNPKSESVPDDLSELNSWRHKLFQLEEDARNHSPVTLSRKNMEKSRSLNSEPEYKTTVVARRDLDSKGNKSKRNTWVGPMQNIPVEPTHARTNEPRCNPSVRRYSATPRQLPAIPNTRNIRRHSHSETTGNYAHLLSDRKATHLNTYTGDPTVSSSRAHHGSIHSQSAVPDGFLKPYPDEGSGRSRTFSSSQ